MKAYGIVFFKIFKMIELQLRPQGPIRIFCAYLAPFVRQIRRFSASGQTKPCLKVILILIILSLFYLQIQDSFITCIAMNVYAYVQNWIQ